jgi:hypothetical protein
VKLLQERGQTFRDGLLNVIELDPELARLPAAKPFAVRSHKYPSLHDFQTFARIVFETPRDKRS